MAKNCITAGHQIYRDVEKLPFGNTRTFTVSGQLIIIESKPQFDLLKHLRVLQPRFVIDEKKGCQTGVANKITYGRLENVVYARHCEDKQSSTLVVEEKKQSSMHIAFSTPIDPKALDLAPLKLFRKHNVVSPFLMYPIYRNHTDQRIYPKADKDFWFFLKDKKFDSLTMKQFKSIIGQIILATEALHAKGLVHRDIKTENILITKIGDDYLVQITDFDSLIEVDGHGIPIQRNKLEILGTKAVFPPELKELEKRYHKYPQTLERLYRQCNFKAFDCYNVGREVRAMCMLNAKYHKDDLQQEFLALDLADRLMTNNPKKRASIEMAKNHPFFGETIAERKEFFNKLHSHFGYSYVNGFHHSSGPPIDDNSAILHPLLTDTYFEVQKLENQVNHLCELEDPILERIKTISEQKKSQDQKLILTLWSNLEETKDCVLANIEQALKSIEKALADASIRSESSYVDQLITLKKHVEDIKNIPSLINHSNLVRKSVRSSIHNFVETKRAPSFIESKSIDVLSTDESSRNYFYLKQWLDFQAKRYAQQKQDRLKAAKVAKQSIQDALQKDSIREDEIYYNILSVMRKEIDRQKHCLKNEDSFSNVYIAIKDLYDFSQSESKLGFALLGKIDRAIQAIDTVLQNPDNKDWNPELIVLKKRINQLKPPDLINVTMANLQNIVNDAFTEYMQNFKDKKARFCDRVEMKLFHWGRGKVAQRLKLEIDNIFKTEMKEEEKLPLELVVDKIFNHLNHGEGSTRRFSFKTILRRKLSELSRLKIEDWKPLVEGMNLGAEPKHHSSSPKR